MTNVVILHHCYESGQGFTIQDMVAPTAQYSWGNLLLFCFTAINGSYFMNLFFFCKSTKVNQISFNCMAVVLKNRCVHVLRCCVVVV